MSRFTNNNNKNCKI